MDWIIIILLEVHLQGEESKHLYLIEFSGDHLEEPNNILESSPLDILGANGLKLLQLREEINLNKSDQNTKRLHAQSKIIL